MPRNDKRRLSQSDETPTKKTKTANNSTKKTKTANNSRKRKNKQILESESDKKSKTKKSDHETVRLEAAHKLEIQTMLEQKESANLDDESEVLHDLFPDDSPSKVPSGIRVGSFQDIRNVPANTFESDQKIEHYRTESLTKISEDRKTRATQITAQYTKLIASAMEKIHADNLLESDQQLQTIQTLTEVVRKMASDQVNREKADEPDEERKKKIEKIDYIEILTSIENDWKNLQIFRTQVRSNFSSFVSSRDASTFFKSADGVIPNAVRWAVKITSSLALVTAVTSIISTFQIPQETLYNRFFSKALEETLRETVDSQPGLQKIATDAIASLGGAAFALMQDKKKLESCQKKGNDCSSEESDYRLSSIENEKAKALAKRGDKAIDTNGEKVDTYEYQLLDYTAKLQAGLEFAKQYGTLKMATVMLIGSGLGAAYVTYSGKRIVKETYKTWVTSTAKTLAANRCWADYRLQEAAIVAKYNTKKAEFRDKNVNFSADMRALKGRYHQDEMQAKHFANTSNTRRLDVNLSASRARMDRKRMTEVRESAINRQDKRAGDMITLLQGFHDDNMKISNHMKEQGLLSALQQVIVTGRSMLFHPTHKVPWMTVFYHLRNTILPRLADVTDLRYQYDMENTLRIVFGQLYDEGMEIYTSSQQNPRLGRATKGILLTDDIIKDNKMDISKKLKKVNWTPSEQIDLSFENVYLYSKPPLTIGPGNVVVAKPAVNSAENRKRLKADFAKQAAQMKTKENMLDIKIWGEAFTKNICSNIGDLLQLNEKKKKAKLDEHDKLFRNVQTNRQTEIEKLTLGSRELLSLQEDQRLTSNIITGIDSQILRNVCIDNSYVLNLPTHHPDVHLKMAPQTRDDFALFTKYKQRISYLFDEESSGTNYGSEEKKSITQKQWLVEYRKRQNKKANKDIKDAIKEINDTFYEFPELLQKTKPKPKMSPENQKMVEIMFNYVSELILQRHPVNVTAKAAVKELVLDQKQRIYYSAYFLHPLQEYEVDPVDTAISYYFGKEFISELNTRMIQLCTKNLNMNLTDQENINFIYTPEIGEWSRSGVQCQHDGGIRKSLTSYDTVEKIMELDGVHSVDPNTSMFISTHLKGHHISQCKLKSLDIFSDMLAESLWNTNPNKHQMIWLYRWMGEDCYKLSSKKEMVTWANPEYIKRFMFLKFALFGSFLFPFLTRKHISQILNRDPKRRHIKHGNPAKFNTCFDAMSADVPIKNKFFMTLDEYCPGNVVISGWDNHGQALTVSMAASTFLTDEMCFKKKLKKRIEVSLREFEIHLMNEIYNLSMLVWKTRQIKVDVVEGLLISNICYKNISNHHLPDVFIPAFSTKTLDANSFIASYPFNRKKDQYSIIMKGKNLFTESTSRSMALLARKLKHVLNKEFQTLPQHISFAGTSPVLTSQVVEMLEKYNNTTNVNNFGERNALDKKSSYPEYKRVDQISLYPDSNERVNQTKRQADDAFQECLTFFGVSSLADELKRTSQQQIIAFQHHVRDFKKICNGNTTTYVQNTFLVDPVVLMFAAPNLVIPGACNWLVIFGDAWFVESTLVAIKNVTTMEGKPLPFYYFKFTKLQKYVDLKISSHGIQFQTFKDVLYSRFWSNYTGPGLFAFSNLK